jgi:small subunit ribosomal protein S20
MKTLDRGSRNLVKVAVHYSSAPFSGARRTRKGDIALANHKSALKRARQNEIRRLRNKASKTRVKNLVKEVRAVAGEASTEEAAAKLNLAKASIAKAAKKGAIHQRTAARKISRLDKLVNSQKA